MSTTAVMPAYGVVEQDLEGIWAVAVQIFDSSPERFDLQTLNLAALKKLRSLERPVHMLG